MQLLEQLANGNLVLQEGLFKVSVSDSDYDKFLDIAKTICDKIELPKDSEEYEKNKRALKQAEEKHISSITLYSVKGKRQKPVNFIQNNIDDLSVSPLYADDIISFISRKYNLSSDNHWAKYRKYDSEVSRAISLKGPLGESSWINISIRVAGYKEANEETRITLSISKKTDKRTEHYNKS